MKAMWNGREIEIPPKIEELLKKRGWSFPPTDEMVREWRDALNRSAGSIHTDPDVVEARWEEDKPGWLREWKENDLEGYRRWRQEATERYHRWKMQQEPEKERRNAR